jgi:hypothetical protein
MPLKKLIFILCLGICDLLMNDTCAQSLYDINTIQIIEITFSQPDWDYQMDTSKYGADQYIMADLVVINGVSYDSVGVKYKGNSSFDSTRIKNPIHIELNNIKKHAYQGFTDIKLSNAYQDPSMIREALAYDVLQHYMHVPQSNFATLYINGTYIGLYSNTESINKTFCGNHFYSSNGTFIKCNPIVNPGPTTKSNLKHISSDSSQYNLYYEIKSDYGWNDLVELCDTITNVSNAASQILDIDRVIWMLAFNNATVNLDSYNGVFAQNHYIYRDHQMRYNPIVWDLNMAFGGFPFAGGGATSMGSLNISGLQQLPADHHATDPYWPLILLIQNNATYKRMYNAHYKTIINEMFDSGYYLTKAADMQNLIQTSVQTDTHKFFSLLQFQQSLDSSVNTGSYFVPGIKTLMDARVSYLQSTPAFMAVAPGISAVEAFPVSPAFNTTVTIRATIAMSGSGNVVLGYRFDSTLSFTKVPMYDDGMHNDGAANDQVYGANVILSGAQLCYYVYAENNDAGMFSPARAEHEFYTLHAASQLPVSGDLVINECLASNLQNQTDEYNDDDDWIELYNRSNTVLDLSDVYLSDELSTLNKWKFPVGTKIVPNGYLIVWADNDTLQKILHAGFKLNKDSGAIFLSVAGGVLLDSVYYGPQNTNISYGRYPNGTGAFTFMNTTFNAENQNYPLSLEASPIDSRPFVFPNPANQTLNFYSKDYNLAKIYGIDGRLLYSTSIESNQLISLPVSFLPEGIYLIQIGANTIRFVISR